MYDFLTKFTFKSTLYGGLHSETARWMALGASFYPQKRICLGFPRLGPSIYRTKCIVHLLLCWFSTGGRQQEGFFLCLELLSFSNIQFLYLIFAQIIENPGGRLCGPFSGPADNFSKSYDGNEFSVPELVFVVPFRKIVLGFYKRSTRTSPQNSLRSGKVAVIGIRSYWESCGNSRHSNNPSWWRPPAAFFSSKFSLLLVRRMYPSSMY
jgi:hypothetical protein